MLVTKLWNTNHRPERVKPAFEASRKKLQLEFVDLYLIHTPFAFQPGDEQDPRDTNGAVVYDKEVTLLDTWRALEALVDEGKCKAIGLSDVSLEQVKGIFDAARIKPAVVHVESHPYLPEWDLLNYCKKNGIVLQAFAALGHSMEPRLLEDPVITAIARRVNKTPAQVLLAWAIQRGTALLTTSKTPGRIKENFDVSAIPEDAVREITEGLKTRVRFNSVVETGVPGFIPRNRLLMESSSPTADRETSRRGARIVIATHGSLGDLYPYVAIALGLKARGQEVIVATSECYRKKSSRWNWFPTGVVTDSNWVTDPEVMRRNHAHPRWGLVRSHSGNSLPGVG